LQGRCYPDSWLTASSLVRGLFVSSNCLVGRWRSSLQSGSSNGSRCKDFATDENPSLQTLWQYALRFCVEELFWTASQVFVRHSRLRSTDALERLYLVAAVSALCHNSRCVRATCTLCVNRLTHTGDEASALLKIGLRYDSGVLHKGRTLLIPSLYSPKTHSLVLLLIEPRNSFMTSFGSHVSIPCPASIDFPFFR